MKLLVYRYKCDPDEPSFVSDILPTWVMAGRGVIEATSSVLKVACILVLYS